MGDTAGEPARPHIPDGLAAAAHVPGDCLRCGSVRPLTYDTRQLAEGTSAWPRCVAT